MFCCRVFFTIVSSRWCVTYRWCWSRLNCFLCSFVLIKIIRPRPVVFGKMLFWLTSSYAVYVMTSLFLKLNISSQLRSAVGAGPQIISCGGCHPNVPKVLDQDSARHAGVQYPICWERTDIRKLMHEPRYIVLGGIDMFPLLQTSLPHIRELLGKRCLQYTKSLQIVSFVDVMCGFSYLETFFWFFFLLI